MQAVRKIAASPIDPRDAFEIRGWRRQARLNRREGARALGISERMLAYYESGEFEVPKTVLLAVRYLANTGDTERTLGRDRWVGVVDAMLRYARGEPVVGEFLKGRQLDRLADLVELGRRGPDPRLALTDPALFRALRDGSTKMHMAGVLAIPELSPTRLRERSLRLARSQEKGQDDVQSTWMRR
jgi:transcriptional regulator with XRE-family HTH domain